MNYLDALLVKSKEKAEAALEELIQQAQEVKPEMNYAEAKTLQLTGLGYYLGYLSDPERIRAMELYPEATHPIFGRQFNLPPKICFNAGIAFARAIELGMDGESATQAARQVIREYNESFNQTENQTETEEKTV
jgi:hypothetical protein